MLSQLLSQLTPCFDDDKQEWQEITQELSYKFPKICWYASSNLDFEPIDLIFHHDVYDKNRHLLLMSDYGNNVIPILKNAYDQLGETPIYIPFQNLYGHVDNVKFHGCYYNFGEIIQIIPLTLWTNEEQKDLTKNNNNINTNIANSVICDDKWHVVYLLIQANNREIPIIFVGAENLLVLNEIIHKYDIEMQSFFAVRVGGKSGSWDATHNFQRGYLPRAIANLPNHLKPKYWGGDCHLNVPDYFIPKPEMAIFNFGYDEGCHFYETTWQ